MYRKQGKVYMTKQELKEKILEIINNNYSEDYVYDEDTGDKVHYFFLDTCIEEIKKLFKEVE